MPQVDIRPQADTQPKLHIRLQVDTRTPGGYWASGYTRFLVGIRPQEDTRIQVYIKPLVDTKPSDEYQANW